MNIVTVTFRRLHGLGNFENEVIEATAMVNHEQPEDTLAALRAWVEEQHQAELKRRGDVLAQEEAVVHHKHTLESLELDIANMRHEWHLAVLFLEKLGIPLPYLYEQKGVTDDDIPF